MVAAVLLHILKTLPVSIMDFEYCTTKMRIIFNLIAPTNENVKDLVFTMTPRSFQYLKLVITLLKKITGNGVRNQLDKTYLINKFAPLLCKPKSGAFMSVKHTHAIPIVL